MEGERWRGRKRGGGYREIVEGGEREVEGERESWKGELEGELEGEGERKREVGGEREEEKERGGWWKEKGRERERWVVERENERRRGWELKRGGRSADRVSYSHTHKHTHPSSACYLSEGGATVIERERSPLHTHSWREKERRTCLTGTHWPTRI